MAERLVLRRPIVPAAAAALVQIEREHIRAQQSVSRCCELIGTLDVISASVFHYIDTATCIDAPTTSSTRYHPSRHLAVTLAGMLQKPCTTCTVTDENVTPI
eukprot:772-Heterococcus_DN1.PRE.3